MHSHKKRNSFERKYGVQHIIYKLFIIMMLALFANTWKLSITRWKKSKSIIPIVIVWLVDSWSILSLICLAELKLLKQAYKGSSNEQSASFVSMSKIKVSQIAEGWSTFSNEKAWDKAESWIRSWKDDLRTKNVIQLTSLLDNSWWCNKKRDVNHYIIREKIVNF